jgi:hypothetical protein
MRAGLADDPWRDDRTAYQRDPTHHMRGAEDRCQSASMPFCNGITTVSPPISGRI